MIDPEPREWRWMRDGTPAQRLAHSIIEQTGVMEYLREYDPVHIGTIAMGINTDTSDIDIACCVKDFDRFESHLREHSTAELPWNVQRITIRSTPAIVGILATEIPVEIYEEFQPVDEQLGFRHYIIAMRLLALGGDALRSKMVTLKSNGWKTEPAFAHLLNLPGDPYLALLELDSSDETELRLRLDRIS